MNLNPDRFLRAGGRISLAEWFLLDEEAQQALADAGDRLQQEYAALIGSACSGPFGPAIVLGEIEAEDIVVRDALARVAQEVIP